MRIISLPPPWKKMHCHWATRVCIRGSMVHAMGQYSILLFQFTYGINFQPQDRKYHSAIRVTNGYTNHITATNRTCCSPENHEFAGCSPLLWLPPNMFWLTNQCWLMNHFFVHESWLVDKSHFLVNEVF